MSPWEASGPHSDSLGLGLRMPVWTMLAQEGSCALVHLHHLGLPKQHGPEGIDHLGPLKGKGPVLGQKVTPPTHRLCVSISGRATPGEPARIPEAAWQMGQSHCFQP